MSPLDRLLEEIHTPEVADDCDDPADLGRVLLFGEALEPDEVDALADALREHARRAREV